MKTNQLTQRQSSRRKFLLVAPLLPLPFLVLFFWAIGGGRESHAKDPAQDSKGFNTSLPGAKIKDQRALDKMSYYDRAAKDSDKLREQRKEDPYTRQKKLPDTAGLHFPTTTNRLAEQPGGPSAAANEAMVYQKIAQLQATINKPQQTFTQPQFNAQPLSSKPPKPTPANNADPELQQMNALLEKILDIQHPERLKEQVKTPQPADTIRFKAVPAIVDGNQKVTQGSVVRIKLLDSINIRGLHIPKGQLVFASGNLYNQRMTFTIKTMRIGYTILPVNLTVYDMTDGLEGISVPEVITDEAIKDGADNGVQSLQFMSLDESVSAQAATAGINAAKGLFSKKVRRIKARLKNGHPLLLRCNG